MSPWLRLGSLIASKSYIPNRLVSSGILLTTAHETHHILDDPVISVNTAALLSVSEPSVNLSFFPSSVSTDLIKMLVTLAYVLPFYISKTTRPSASLSRDAPSVIRSRVRAVTLACIGSTFFVVALASLQGDISLPETLKMLGWWPIGFVEIAQSLLLTAVLFSGPLFERGIAEGDWRSWVRGEGLSETLRSWIGFRNFVAVCVVSLQKEQQTNDNY